MNVISFAQGGAIGAAGVALILGPMLLDANGDLVAQERRYQNLMAQNESELRAENQLQDQQIRDLLGQNAALEGLVREANTAQRADRERLAAIQAEAERLGEELRRAVNAVDEDDQCITQRGGSDGAIGISDAILGLLSDENAGWAASAHGLCAPVSSSGCFLSDSAARLWCADHFPAGDAGAGGAPFGAP